jgi:hypothetical protein
MRGRSPMLTLDRLVRVPRHRLVRPWRAGNPDRRRVLGRRLLKRVRGVLPAVCAVRYSPLQRRVQVCLANTAVCGSGAMRQTARPGLTQR